MSRPLSAAAVAHPNLALIKYWGQTNAERNLPANDSLSVNLSGAQTRTEVRFTSALTDDDITLNGVAADAETRKRVTAHLDRVRALAQIPLRARVTSRNDFPAGAGIASSASAFAALSLAASHAAGLKLDASALSRLARLGSGSACRSIPDGFAYWPTGPETEAYARQLAPPEHWELRIITTYFRRTAPKMVTSLEGHRAAPTSPFYRARLAQLPQRLARARNALLDRDLETIGPLVEREAISLHAVAMTSQPVGHPEISGIYYWAPETLAVIHAVQRWRRDGVPVYFTLDAGASVHLLCEAATQPTVEARLTSLLEDLHGTYFISRPGRGARLVA